MAKGFYGGLLEGWYDPAVDLLVWDFCDLADFHMLAHTSPAILAKPLLLLGAASTAILAILGAASAAWGVVSPLYLIRFLFWLGL